MKHWTRWFLAFVITIQAFGNSIWLARNIAPLPWDPASHTWIALDIYQKIHQFSFAGIFAASNYYPIFVHTITAIVMLVTGPSILTAQIIGTIFFLFSIFGVYLLTNILYRKESIALLAATIFSLMPINYSQSHFLMLDIPTVTMFVYTLYFLEQSQQLTHKWYSLFTFITAACLLMTKWTGILLLFVPVVRLLWAIILSKKWTATIKQNFINLLILSSLVAPWYVYNFSSLLLLSKINIIGEADKPHNIISVSYLLQYVVFFLNFQVTSLAALCSLFAAIGMLVTKLNHKYYLLLTWLSIFLSFTIISNKDPRYTMPMLPIVAIVIAVGLWLLFQRFKVAGLILISLLLIYLGTTFVVLTLRPKRIEGYTLALKVPALGWINIFAVNDTVSERYNEYAWPTQQIVTDVSNTQDDTTNLLVAIEDEHVNPSNLQTYLKLAKVHGKSAHVSIMTPDTAYLITNYGKASFPNQSSLESYIMQNNYVLIKDNGVGAQYLRNESALLQITRYIQANNARSCDSYQHQIAPVDTVCTVFPNEVLQTTSDVTVNNTPVVSNPRIIHGGATVYCHWGCSFGIVQVGMQHARLEFVKQKSYTTPDHQTMTLYKIQASNLTQ